MDTDQLFQRYRELQDYVGWSEADGLRVAAVAELLDPSLPALIDDFYAQIERHPAARKVIVGGPAQIERLKGMLLRWVRELLMGRYDADYVDRRWKVGWRHVEIGLDQVYTNVALARLRTGLTEAIRKVCHPARIDVELTLSSLNKLLDLDLAIIEEAYQAEYSARIQRTERMATLGQISGGVAHELRNPLNVVKTSVYYLLNARTLSAEKQAEHLKRIERQVTLADGVITTLSNFAKMPMPTLRPSPILPCIESAIELASRPAQVDVLIIIPETLPRAFADEDQLRIVFGNLIRNAYDAMAGGGRLLIKSAVVDDNLEVSFDDNGIGIAKSDLLRIMEPLYSTKARGLGLGLAIVRAILEKSGGSLHVESREGLGSVFTVRLKPDLEPGEEGTLS